MNKRTTKLIVIAFAIAAIFAGIGYYIGKRPSLQHEKPADEAPASQQTRPVPVPTPSDAAPAQSNERKKPLYWHDPMVPGPRFDKPGKSPFMDMQLVPVYADEASGEGGVKISPQTLQNLGIRTATVESGTFARRIDTVGAVRADERRMSVVQSRAAGWVERLHVRAANDPVKRGQLLAEIYAPDVLAAQEEYVLALRHGDPDLMRAAKERLFLLGLSEAQVQRIAQSGSAERRVALYSPVSGIVAELGVREGAQVTPGMALFNLVDLSSVWVTAEIIENQAAWIGQGNRTEVRVAALPGKVFVGPVDYVYPEITAASRTLKARIVLDNRAGELKPGMYADVRLFGSDKQDVLTVPNEAVIRTGTRSVVVLAEGEDRFRPVEVEAGFETGDRTEILKGLEKGQTVVASGQFLIDSEASLRGALRRLSGSEESSAAKDAKGEDAVSK
jgi:membrane fusion protein, copper/silver efflux system